MVLRGGKIVRGGLIAFLVFVAGCLGGANVHAQGHSHAGHGGSHSMGHAGHYGGSHAGHSHYYGSGLGYGGLGYSGLGYGGLGYSGISIGFGSYSGLGGYYGSPYYGSSYRYPYSSLGYSGYGVGYSSYYPRPSVVYVPSPSYGSTYSYGYAPSYSAGTTSVAPSSNVYRGGVNERGEPTGDLRPGMVLPDGARVISVGGQ